jgi:hypothetical protein
MIEPRCTDVVESRTFLGICHLTGVFRVSYVGPKYCVHIPPIKIKSKHLQWTAIKGNLRKTFVFFKRIIYEPQGVPP